MVHEVKYIKDPNLPKNASLFWQDIATKKEKVRKVKIPYFQLKSTWYNQEYKISGYIVLVFTGKKAKELVYSGAHDWNHV